MTVLDTLHHKYPTSEVQEGRDSDFSSDDEERESRQRRGSAPIKKIVSSPSSLKGSKSHDVLYYSLEDDKVVETPSRSSSVHGLSSLAEPASTNINNNNEEIQIEIQTESSESDGDLR